MTYKDSLHIVTGISNIDVQLESVVAVVVRGTVVQVHTVHRRPITLVVVERRPPDEKGWSRGLQRGHVVLSIGKRRDGGSGSNGWLCAEELLPNVRLGRQRNDAVAGEGWVEAHGRGGILGGGGCGGGGGGWCAKLPSVRLGQQRNAVGEGRVEAHGRGEKYSARGGVERLRAGGCEQEVAVAVAVVDATAGGSVPHTVSGSVGSFVGGC